MSRFRNHAVLVGKAWDVGFFDLPDFSFGITTFCTNLRISSNNLYPHPFNKGGESNVIPGAAIATKEGEAPTSEARKGVNGDRDLAKSYSRTMMSAKLLRLQTTEEGQAGFGAEQLKVVLNAFFKVPFVCSFSCSASQRTRGMLTPPRNTHAFPMLLSYFCALPPIRFPRVLQFAFVSIAPDEHNHGSRWGRSPIGRRRPNRGLHW